jgi:hypothetical protein
MKQKTSAPADDPEFDPKELEEAVSEDNHTPIPPEVTPETAQLTEWDKPPTTTGAAAPKVGPDDEAMIGKDLAEEGVEAADRDQRIAAVDPDFEP